MRVSLEDIDVPLRHVGAKMIEGASVAEPEFEHNARNVGDLADRPVEAGALRL